MSERATRRSRPRDRRSQLAHVAAELFRERGYHGVGINDIAAAAGVTGPALYRHFADKQAILAHVVLSGITDMLTVTRNAIDPPQAPAPQQVENLLAALAELAVERRELAALWRWEGAQLSRDDQADIRSQSAELLGAWRGALRGIRPELSDADAELLCWAALSVFGSVAVHRSSVPKRRFEHLLAGLARQVLHTELPPRDGTEPSPSPGDGLGSPARREQLLTAATELFHQHGYQPVSMEDIGRAAGIAGPSVYRHFPGKAALLAAICKRAADRLMVGADYALRTSAPPDEAEGLRRLAESYVHTLTESPELAVSFSSAPRHITDADRDELLRVQRDYVAQWVRLHGAVHPEFSQRESRIAVHAALTIANDLTRTRRISTRPHLRTELVTVLHAVLEL